MLHFNSQINSMNIQIRSYCKHLFRNEPTDHYVFKDVKYINSISQKFSLLQTRIIKVETLMFYRGVYYSNKKFFYTEDISYFILVLL